MLQAQATSATDQVIGDFGGVQVPAGGTAAIDLQFEGAEKATVVVVSDHLGTITPTLAGASFGSATLFETEVLAAALTTPPDGQLEITNTGTELASVVALASRIRIIAPTILTRSVRLSAGHRYGRKRFNVSQPSWRA